MSIHRQINFLLKTPQHDHFKGLCSEKEEAANNAFICELGTWHLNDLHSVQQGRRDGSGGVGSGYEKDLGKVKGHVQIVVCEVMVLLRIQHLRENRSRKQMQASNRKLYE